MYRLNFPFRNILRHIIKLFEFATTVVDKNILEPVNYLKSKEPVFQRHSKRDISRMAEF